MTVYTIFYKGNDSRYGYESSQISRQTIFDALGIEHTILLGLPLPYPNWRQRMEEIGYTNYVSICNRYSDIANDPLDISLERYLKDKKVVLVERNSSSLSILEEGKEKNIYLTEDDVITHIEDEDFIYFYTSDLYLRKEKKTSNLYWYNKDGSIAMRGEPGIKADYIFYDSDDSLIGNTDTLMKLFLSQNLNWNDSLIYDPLFTIAGDLKRLLRMKGIKTYQVIHYNILAPNFSHVVPALKPWLYYLVASEKLVEPLRNLGLTVDFLPPTHVNHVSLPKAYPRVTDYCLVGSYSYIKRIEMAVAAFLELEKRGIDVRLTIYGGDNQDIEDFKKVNQIPNNVTFVTMRDEVPYEQHEAYLSCSQSECFANAMVEASSHGLVILASNVDLAHRQYATMSKELRLFDDKEDMVAIISQLSKSGGSSATEIAEHYKADNVMALYQTIFSDRREQ